MVYKSDVEPLRRSLRRTYQAMDSPICVTYIWDTRGPKHHPSVLVHGSSEVACPSTHRHPPLMHLSLAIFFVGLTLFLLPLRRSIAGIVGSASVYVFAAYIGTAVWPLFYVQCPYRTPLAGIIHWFFFVVRKYVLRNVFSDYSTLQKGRTISNCSVQ